MSIINRRNAMLRLAGLERSRRLGQAAGDEQGVRRRRHGRARRAALAASDRGRGRRADLLASAPRRCRPSGRGRSVAGSSDWPRERPARASRPIPATRARRARTRTSRDKPVEEVQRELGLERVVKLASNEGPFGPFPAALEAIAAAARDGNRYPDGGCCRLTHALAERHGVDPQEITVAAGADAVIGYVSPTRPRPGGRGRDRLAVLPELRARPAQARRGSVVRVPLRDLRFDLDATARRDHAADEARLRRDAEQPDRDDDHPGRARRRTSLACPEHVVTVIDQAYFEYIDDPDYPDAVEEYAKRGHRVLVLRTFSKIYGLAGLPGRLRRRSGCARRRRSTRCSGPST